MLDSARFFGPFGLAAHVEPERTAYEDEAETDQLGLGEAEKNFFVDSPILDDDATGSVERQVFPQQERALVSTPPKERGHRKQPRDLVELGGVNRFESGRGALWETQSPRYVRHLAVVKPDEAAADPALGLPDSKGGCYGVGELQG